MSVARQLDPPSPQPRPAPSELDEALAEIADDAAQDPQGYARDTRVPEGCE